MPLAKLHVLDGQYDEARLNEVSSAVTMVLMVSFSCRISLLTLTVIFFDKMTAGDFAVETSAILRTCAVPAMKLTLSVKSFEVPATQALAPGRQAFLQSRPPAQHASLRTRMR